MKNGRVGLGALFPMQDEDERVSLLFAEQLLIETHNKHKGEAYCRIVDISHAFVQKCDENIHAQGNHLLCGMGNDEVGFESDLRIIQINAVEAPSNCCESCEPCYTESSDTAIPGPYSLVELIVGGSHSRGCGVAARGQRMNLECVAVELRVPAQKACVSTG